MEQQVAALREMYRQMASYFFEQQLKITTKAASGSGDTLVPYKLNRIQKRLLAYVLHCIKNGKPIRMIILKARQLGISTLVQAIVFWRAVLNQNMNALTMAHDNPTSEAIFKMAKVFYENMSAMIRPQRRYSTKRELDFRSSEKEAAEGNPGLGSRISVQTAGNASSGAGMTLHILHLSECGRYEHLEDLKEAVFPAVPDAPGTIIIMESTAKGAGTEFYNEWQRALSGNSTFEPFFAAWWELEEYAKDFADGEMDDLDAEERALVELFKLDLRQLKWRRDKIKELGGLPDFKQSFPATPEEAWVTAGDPVFEGAVLDKLFETVSHPKYLGEIVGMELRVAYENHEEMDDLLAVWEMPKKEESYDLAADVALGGPDGDFSVLVVIERYGKRVMAVWRGKMDPFDFADLIESVGNFYNTAQVAVEVTGPGYATNHKLNSTYANLYRGRDRTQATNKLKSKTGWDTSQKSKRYMISLARTQFRKYPQLRSRGLWMELTRFVDYGNEVYRGAPGFHDDYVMAYLIALVISDDENYGDEHMQQQEKPKVIPMDPATCDTGWDAIMAGGKVRGDFYDM